MIKQYPILYSRDTKGKIRVWMMEQEDNKYRTISSLEDGEKVITNWSTCDSKNINRSNETTPIEQATKEIESKYKDQESTGYFKSREDIDQKLYFSPMLAHKWQDFGSKIDWSDGVYISPKMDGLRCVITKHGAFSRNGKTFISFPHILRELQPLFNKYPDLICDGEIYCDKLSHDFEKIISLAKKIKPTKEDLVESEKYIQYWIFDCPTIEGWFHNRYHYLQKLLVENGLLNNKWIKLCKHKLIKTPEEIEINLNKYIECSFEGLMINTYKGEYQQKRSKNLLKYKLFQDCEAEIIDIIKGEGNRDKMFGYAKLKLDNGKEFDSNARGNEDLYKYILNNKEKYIGKKATVRYQNLTNDGIPRFPVIIDFDRID